MMPVSLFLPKDNENEISKSFLHAPIEHGEDKYHKYHTGIYDVDYIRYRVRT